MKGKISLSIVVILLIGLPIFIAALMLEKDQRGLNFTPKAFMDLPGWQQDDLLGAMAAFEKSCAALLKQPAGKPLPGAPVAGVAGDWHPACRAAENLSQDQKQDTAKLRAFFEHWFQPFLVDFDGDSAGLFTGYFEPVLRGSRKKSNTYTVPLYIRPPDLVMVNLGDFRADLKGRRIAGSVVGGRLKPYADRKGIESGALEGRGLELIYVDSLIDAFVLHIQGSGRVRMDDGSLIKVGYAAQNGHPYRAIGRDLIAMGAIKRENMSMQAIVRWLKDNPAAGIDVMHKNASFIFFRELEGVDGPFGSGGVSLTPARSLAVDRKHLPLHTPVYLAATYPDPDNSGSAALPFNRLMVAQDTGGAIKGGVRGDVFWGMGEEAKEIAGRMANAGRYYIFLPQSLAQKAMQD